MRRSATGPRVKSIAALRRGIDVLHAIERTPAATLAELHRQTLVPKATLLRILKTLQEAGWIERNDSDARYVRTPAAGEAGPVHEWRMRLTELAAQPLATLQRRLPWPSDLAVRDGTAMLVLDTHRPLVGLSVNYRVIGFRPHMLLSALGRCYLSFCPDAECAEILAALARSPYEVDRASRRPDAIRRMVAHARQQGYAARDPHHVGADTRMTQRFGAIAVPVHYDERVIACLSCAWLSTVVSEQEIVRAHLEDLVGAAQAIADKLRRARFPLFAV